MKDINFRPMFLPDLRNQYCFIVVIIVRQYSSIGLERNKKIKNGKVHTACISNNKNVIGFVIFLKNIYLSVV